MPLGHEPTLPFGVGEQMEKIPLEVRPPRESELPKVTPAPPAVLPGCVPGALAPLQGARGSLWHVCFS